MTNKIIKNSLESQAKLTPMLKQYYNAKKKHPNALLLFRMGDFYELFGQDAVKASEVLDIVLTSRHQYKDGPQMEMCGVPCHAIDSYLNKLVKAGYKVAICEQVEDPRQARGLVKREVVRVVTPGTYDEEGYLSARSNNYILAFVQSKNILGLAWADISTGQLWVRDLTLQENQTTSGQKIVNLSPVAALLARLQPNEILYNQKHNVQDAPDHFLIDWLKKQQIALSPFADWAFLPKNSLQVVQRHFSVSLKGLGVDKSWTSVIALGALLSYLQETQKQDFKHLKTLRVDRLEDKMFLDAYSIDSLELLENSTTSNTKASLLGVLNKFLLTPMGHRELKKWIVQPLIQKKAIEKRLQTVEFFTQKQDLQEKIQNHLKPLGDIERLSSRLALSRINPSQLKQLGHSVKEIEKLIQTLQKTTKSPGWLASWATELSALPKLQKKIDQALVDQPPVLLGKEKSVIRTGYHQELDELRAIQKNGQEWIRNFEQKEKKSTDIASLKVRYNKVFGYYIEVSKANLSKVPDSYIRKQTLTNAERYITPVLKEYEAKVLGAQERIIELEQDLYQKLLIELQEYITSLQKNAHVLSHIDVLHNFSRLALANDYVKPQLTEGQELIIQAGRHPVVEKISQSEFIANNTNLSAQSHQIMILTGPNMAGKSTYLRQVALITLMAQIGSFVPATSATIGVVDRIFTRIGASDNLARGESTFMVEMQEAANILNHATYKSLIILDELGRGTSTFDGLSIAWATIEYLQRDKKRGPKTLFATHYHELVQLSESLDRVENWNVTVLEHQEKIIFLHRIEPGPADDSYGIQVAQLAGVPLEVITRAQEILPTLEDQLSLSSQKTKNNDQTNSKKTKTTTSQVSKLGQLSFIAPSLDSTTLQNPEQTAVIQELKQLSLNQITPLQALQKLMKWQKKL